MHRAHAPDDVARLEDDGAPDGGRAHAHHVDLTGSRGRDDTTRLLVRVGGERDHREKQGRERAPSDH